MPAERHELAVARRPGAGDGTHRLQPAGDAATPLGRAAPPAAARGHDDQGRQLRTAAGNRGANIESPGARASRVNHGDGVRAVARQRAQPLALEARDLQGRRTEGLRESRRVERIKPRPATASRQHDGLVPALPHFAEHAAPAFASGLREPGGRGFRQADLGVAAERAEAAAHALAAGKSRAEHRQPFDAFAADLAAAGLRIDAIDIERYEPAFYAQYGGLAGQPVPAFPVFAARRAMVALAVVMLDPGPDPGL